MMMMIIIMIMIKIAKWNKFNSNLAHLETKLSRVQKGSKMS